MRGRFSFGTSSAECQQQLTFCTLRIAVNKDYDSKVLKKITRTRHTTIGWDSRPLRQLTAFLSPAPGLFFSPTHPEIPF